MSFSLSEFQHEILQECIEKQTGGLSLPMGTGKTIIALHIALSLSPTSPLLIVVSKTLLSSWENEIKKFYGTSLSYDILHPEYFHPKKRPFSQWKFSETRLLFTTPQVISQAYQTHQIERHFVMQVPNEHIGFTNVYHPPEHPLLSPSSVQHGMGLLYTTRWGVVIVDEAHGYCNILTNKCRSIASLCRNYCWLLSGTMFNEPKPENVLGYFSMLHHPDTPRDLMGMTHFLRYNKRFQGLHTTLVHRQTTGREPPAYEMENEYIHVKMSREEIIVYEGIQKVLKKLNTCLRRSVTTEQRRKYASFLLAVITYLRQIFVAPIIVFSSVALDVCKLKDRSELSVILRDEFQEAGLSQWFDTREALYSTRLRSVIEKMETMQTTNNVPRIIIFSAFRTSLRLLESLIQEENEKKFEKFQNFKRWECFSLESSQSVTKKQQTLNEFQQSQKGVLLLSYKLGSEGLNLQHCNTVFLLDMLWNAGAKEQAIARVARQGQLSEKVHVVTFMSNTGMEKAMLEKHIHKKEIAKELMQGTSSKFYESMKVEDIVKMVLDEDTSKLYRQLL
jgi:SNF2 family DNA or RNA helicase